MKNSYNNHLHLQHQSTIFTSWSVHTNWLYFRSDNVSDKVSYLTEQMDIVPIDI